MAVLAANPSQFDIAIEIAMSAEASGKDRGGSEGVFHAGYSGGNRSNLNSREGYGNGRGQPNYNRGQSQNNYRGQYNRGQFNNRGQYNRGKFNNRGHYNYRGQPNNRGQFNGNGAQRGAPNNRRGYANMVSGHQEDAEEFFRQ